MGVQRRCDACDSRVERGKRVNMYMLDIPKSLHKKHNGTWHNLDFCSVACWLEWCNRFALTAVSSAGADTTE